MLFVIWLLTLWKKCFYDSTPTPSTKQHEREWTLQTLRHMFDDASNNDDRLSFHGCSYIITTRPSAPATNDHPQLMVARTGAQYLLVCCCPGVYVVVLTKGCRARMHHASEWLKQLTRHIAGRSARHWSATAHWLFMPNTSVWILRRESQTPKIFVQLHRSGGWLWKFRGFQHSVLSPLTYKIWRNTATNLTRPTIAVGQPTFATQSFTLSASGDNRH